MSEQNGMLDESIIDPAISKLEQISGEIATILHEVNCLPFGNASIKESEGQNAQNMKLSNIYFACCLLALIGIVDNTKKFLSEAKDAYSDTDDSLAN